MGHKVGGGRGGSGRALALVAALAALPACAGAQFHNLPIASTMVGNDSQPEIRVPNPNRQLRRLCDAAGATDCYDTFWRIEAVTATEVVLRYRRVGFDERMIHAPADFIARATLHTQDGRSVGGFIHTRFTSEALAPVTNQALPSPITSNDATEGPDDSSTIQQPPPEMVPLGQPYQRFSGYNYIVFPGVNLVQAQTLYIELHIAKGPGLAAQIYRWSFDRSAPVDVATSTSPENDRPDLAARAPVHRK